MAIPPTAIQIAQPMDPQEELDFEIIVAGLLESGETVSSWTLALLAESMALGLQIMTGAGRDPVFDPMSDTIAFWLRIEAGQQMNSAFDAGAALPMEVTLTTMDAGPARKRQRTVTVRVVHQ